MQSSSTKYTKATCLLSQEQSHKSKVVYSSVDRLLAKKVKRALRLFAASDHCSESSSQKPLSIRRLLTVFAQLFGEILLDSLYRYPDLLHSVPISDGNLIVFFDSLNINGYAPQSADFVLPAIQSAY